MNTVVQARPPGNRQQPVTAGFHVESVHKKLATWLAALVDESKTKGKPVAQLIKLTPDLAELLLERNPENRRINSNLVDMFASDMAGGRWSMNGEPIIVSDTGELNDGQHRCMAVQYSKATIDALLVVGVSRDSRATLDQGRVRTVADYLAMDGHVDSVVLGAAASLLWSYRNRGFIYPGGVVGAGKATKGEVRSLAAVTPGLARSVSIAGVKAMPIGGRGVIAFCHFVFSGQNREAADEFIHSLMEGAGLKACNAILYARNRLIQERGRLRSPEKVELLFRSWNAWRRGDATTRLPLLGGVLPVLEK